MSIFRHSRGLLAGPEAVIAAFSDPARLARWRGLTGKTTPINQNPKNRSPGPDSHQVSQSAVVFRAHLPPPIGIVSESDDSAMPFRAHPTQSSPTWSFRRYMHTTRKKNKPDFSGSWLFNRTKSVLQIHAPDSTSFFIDHHEPLFAIQRTHTIGETKDGFAIQLNTGGETTTTNHRDLHISARAYWDGDVLVFHSEIMKGQEKGTNIVRYELRDDGRTIIAEEDFRSSTLNYTNRWVLEKQ